MASAPDAREPKVSETRPAIPAATQQAQSRASDPRQSAWVSANAGAGKTFVLAQRVLRLLLNGCDPASLLCLTFTKAAAAEMAQRVFDDLAGWTRLDDKQLSTLLAERYGHRVSTGSQALRRARALFAQALETPGGLKIQTIHAFCESLLHQFPLEANVAASFRVLDDRDAAQLMQAARDAVFVRAGTGQDPALAESLEGALATFADASLEEAIDAVLANRSALLAGFEDTAAQTVEDRLQVLSARHAEAIGCEISNPQAVRQAIRDPLANSPYLTPARIEAIGDTADAGTATDQKNARLLSAALNAPSPAERRAAYDEALFTKSGSARAAYARDTDGSLKLNADGEPKSSYFFRVREALPDALDWVEAEQRRASALLAQSGHINLMHLALAALETFERQKARAGLLDFDDLIDRTASLLTRSDARDWVRFKMDQRIDHILVDEAQDTSPRQWSIIRALADEFFVGEGRREAGPPTFFAVGDEKQSIYSFQGADPRAFRATRRALETKAQQAETPFDARLGLTLSFRSRGDVLAAVDAVFADPSARDGVAEADGLVHEAYRRGRGLVELWPVIVGTREDEPEAWTEPVDALPAPHVRLAGAVAAKVRTLIDSGQAPGDILVLLRRRGAMLNAITFELKRQNVPVAGADRIVLTDHIAVQDLIALMRAMLLPEDDLTLATLLKSPLIGLSDATLEALCVGRRGFLIDALNAETDVPAIKNAAQTIARWRAMADFASPFAFLSTVLGRDGGRRKMMARLGEDCLDPLDEVVRLARAEEQRPGSGLLSLEAFVDALGRADIEVKRDMEARANQVRIMTVHGAKGLEAGTVILVDTCTIPQSPRGLVMPDGPDPDPLAPGGNRPPPSPLYLRGGPSALAYADIKAGLMARQMQEYRRLLYVAMTRARDQLIVTGHVSASAGAPHPQSWYALIDRALGAEARDVGVPDGLDAPARLWRAQPWPEPSEEPDVDTHKRDASETSDEAAVAALLAQLKAPLPIRQAAVPLRPSSARRDAGSDAQGWSAQREADRHAALDERLRQTLDGEDAHLPPGRDALAFGTLVHALLERDAPPDRELAARLDRARAGADTAGGGLPLSDERLDAALQQAATVRALPDTLPLYPTTPGSIARAEVPIRGALVDARGVARPVSGSIDRLVIAPDAVLAVDFKTNAKPPPADALETEAGDYCAQMAVYAALLGRLYPGRPVRCGLLWTAAPRLDWLPDDMVAASLASMGLTAS